MIYAQEPLDCFVALLRTRPKARDLSGTKEKEPDRWFKKGHVKPRSVVGDGLTLLSHRARASLTPWKCPTPSPPRHRSKTMSETSTISPLTILPSQQTTHQLPSIQSKTFYEFAPKPSRLSRTIIFFFQHQRPPALKMRQVCNTSKLKTIPMMHKRALSAGREEFDSTHPQCTAP